MVNSKMSIENQILSRCGILENENMQFDVGLFFRNLLLFDNFILDSIRLKEFPHLVNYIGFDQTIELLKYRHFKIRCMQLSIGSVGQTSVLGRTKETLLPLGSYSFAGVMTADRRKYISSCLKCIDDIPSISFKQKKKLKKVIASNVIDEVPEIITSALIQMQDDIEVNSPTIKTSLLFHLRREHNIHKLPDNLTLKINRISEKEFSAEQNLFQILGLSELEAHRAIERALLAVGGLNLRISEMRGFQALSGFKIQELPIFEDKLSFIVNRVSPDNKIDQFDRVIEITDMPSFDDIGTKFELNIDKLLKIRESKECIEFRDWLSTISDLGDKEIKERIESFRNVVGSAIGGKVGKAVRFLVSALSGFLDGGAVTGPAIGAVDAFILDRLFPSKGPITFLNRKYPSIFDKLTEDESNVTLSRGHG